jgi:hypothetical protein
VLKNCLARIGCLTVLVGMVAGAWLYRGEISDWWSRLERRTEISEPSESLAAEAASKIESLSTRSAPQLVRLDEAELQSLLTFRIARTLPEGVEAPVVEVRDSTLVLSAEIDLDAFADESTVAALESLLGDSTHVTVELEPDVLRAGVGLVSVRGLRAGALPVPSLMVPMLLQQIEIPGADVTGSTILFALPEKMNRMKVSGGLLEIGTIEVP